MSFVLIQNGQVVAYPYSLTTFRTANPTISLPAEPTEAQLNEQGIYTVNVTNMPTFNERSQLIHEGAPELTDGVYVQTWTTTQLTPEEIDANTQSQWAKVRAQRNQILAESDWTQGKDIADSVSAAWQPYRQALRDITTQSDPYNIKWPVAP